MRATIQTNFVTKNIAIGASIACSGVCLTVVTKGDNWFAVDISAQTIACTNISNWKKNTQINLERALRAGDELGGHIVSGHVDAVANVEEITPCDASRIMAFTIHDHLTKFIAAKGSVTIDGVSLTVNEVIGNKFTVNIIPHTLQQTTLGKLSKACKVNLEIDMLARYVAARLG